MDGSRNRRFPARWPLRGVAAVAAIAATALPAGCSGPGARHSSAESPAAAGSTAPAALSSAAAGLQDDYERVVRQVLPSVVQITSDSGLGSGVVYDTKGDIVTNAHVVQAAHNFKVTLATGKGNLSATLVGSYPADDIAVIRIGHPPNDLRPAVFGRSSDVQVGQITLAMGNPLGLSSSVTEGIVSAVGRTVNEGMGTTATPGATIANLVQTSAAINPGNSGGALVNLTGQVIGIPTLAAVDPDLSGSEAAGIGFAIPASTVTDIAGQLVEHGKVIRSGRAALGIAVRTMLGPDLRPAGATVVSEVDDGAAYRAGIKVGDVIRALGRTPVTSAESLSEALTAYKPGAHTHVTFDRDGRVRTVRVRLGQL